MAEFFKKINVFWVPFENKNLFSFPPNYLRVKKGNWFQENHPDNLKVFTEVQYIIIC